MQSQNILSNVLIIGNSDGIGLELTRSLLAQGHSVVGISRSDSALKNSHYRHIIQDVTHPNYESILVQTLATLEPIDLCVYCAGIGIKMNHDDLTSENTTMQVNLMAALITTNAVVAKMKKQKRGHFIGLSSIADCVTSTTSPAYAASKAGISRYWEGMALAFAKYNVKISNIRFGFVDTKMAHPPVRFIMMSQKSAVNFIQSVIKKPRIRATKPITTDWLARLQECWNRFLVLVR